MTFRVFKKLVTLLLNTLFMTTSFPHEPQGRHHRSVFDNIMCITLCIMKLEVLDITSYGHFHCLSALSPSSLFALLLLLPSFAVAEKW